MSISFFRKNKKAQERFLAPENECNMNENEKSQKELDAL